MSGTHVPAHEVVDGCDPVDQLPPSKSLNAAARMTAPYYKLFSYADEWDYALMLVGGFAAIAHGASVPVFFIFFGRLLNTLGNPATIPTNLEEEARKYCLYFVYLSCVRFVSGWVEVSAWMYAGERQSARIRVEYMKALMRQEIGLFDTDTSTAQIIAGISSDTALLQDAIGQKTGNLIYCFSTFIVGIAVAFSFLWKLSIVTVAVLPVMAGSGGLYAINLLGLARKSQLAYVSAGGIAQEVFGQIRTVKAFVGEEKACKSYAETLLLNRKIGKRSGLIKGLGIGCLYGSGFASFALLMWYAGKLVRNGDANGGLAFATILNVICSTLALGQAAPDFAAISKAKVSGYTIFKMINRKPQVAHNTDAGVVLKNVIGDVELKNVQFSYPSRPNITVFEDLSLSIPSGKVVAIVGSSGSGKSTIIALLERFYDPISGEIYLDGNNLKSLQLKWLREQMGLVNQEPALFTTSILENIMYGKAGDVSMKEVVHAAKIASAHEFIELLPASYKTQVGERGIQLSGGQKQRIAIARAMLRNPSILLLDEATSALDVESEKYVQEALDRVMRGRTTVVVAHRLSTIEHADIIAVLQEGQVVEVGSHAELVNKGGTYATLVSLQRHTPHNLPPSPNAKLSHQRASSIGSMRSLSGLTAQRSMSSRSIPVDLSLVQGSFRRSLSQRSFSFHSSTMDPSLILPVGADLKMDDLDLDDDDTPIQSKSPLRKLISLNSKEWQFALLSALAAFVVGGALPLFAWVVTQALDYMYSPTDHVMKKELAKTSLLLCALSVIMVLASTCENYFSGIAGENITMRIRNMMFAAMLRNEVGWFDKNSSIVVSSRLSVDAPQVRTALVDRTVNLVQNFGLILTAFVIAIRLQWKISLVLISILPVLILQMAGQVQFSKGFGGDVNKAYMRANSLAGEAVSNIRTVAAFGAEDKLLDLFCKELEGPQKQAFARGQISGFGFGSSEGMLYASFALVFWYASKLMGRGEVTFGELIKCFMVLTVTAYGVSEALSLAPEVFKSTDSLSYVLRILERRPKIGTEDGERVDKVEGVISFRHVDFSYPARPDVQIFKDFTMNMESGKSVALVGASGSGKSSVIALIMRFYDPQEGSVMIDGKNIKQLQLMSLRRHIAMVQQEPALFSASIYANILYGREGASEAEVIEAARAANAHNFISALPDGYSTEVGERGVQLSGGQKQRVAIARAVLRNPTILLLDEATSALDAESEKLVQSALDPLMVGRTTVLVAHRLSTVQNADSIAVLQSGTIVEQGPHAKLLEEKGAYFQLHGLAK